MTQMLADKDIHVSNYQGWHQPAASGPAWFERLHREAIARFRQHGFPTTREEDWRFTSVAPIARTPFRPAEPDHQLVAAPAAARFGFGDDAAAEIVFVNGHFSPALSRLDGLPRGVRVENLADALAADPDRIEPHLARHARIADNPFVALNTGFIRDGAFIHFARGVVVDRPIHLLFITSPSGQPAVSHPRVLVIAEDNVIATLVESYAGADRGVYFTNAVTEVVLGQNARLDHCKLQQEALEAFHVASMRVELARSANFVSHSATLGAKLTRNDLGVLLNGEGADATLNGLVIIGGTQHCDNHTLLHHEKAHCPSHELYKHVLDGRATCVFRGKIFVQKDAQKTDSKQTSKSLLLSDEVAMNSQPALEIYADDVKCTHGSTTGPVDEEMIFYLRSRGVGIEAARHLLTYAFAADVTRRIRVEPVRRRLEDFMAAQHGLPQDLRITDLGRHDEAAL
jgi:Fe-S cluster assembly protein SufD